MIQPKKLKKKDLAQKIKSIGRVFFLLLTLNFTLNGCGDTTVNKFDWLPSESAPLNYPMKIVNGAFSDVDGKNIGIPSGKLIHKGWGTSVSTHIIGKQFKKLPHKVSVTFFSYTENKFYQAEFDLPYDKILELFQQGYYALGARRQTTYNKIVVGVSPGGGVAVWVSGRHKKIQVAYAKAVEVDIPWSRITENEMPREEYVRLSINESASPEVKEKLKTEGPPLNQWDNYQTRYHWRPHFVTENRPPKMIRYITYVNGEIDYLFFPLTPELAQATRAVPTEINYHWRSPNGHYLDHTFNFDEAEVTAAFETLNQQHKVTADDPLLLTVYLWESDKGLSYGVAAQHGETEIILKNNQFEQYSSDGDNADLFYEDDLKKPASE